MKTWSDSVPSFALAALLAATTSHRSAGQLAVDSPTSLAPLKVVDLKYIDRSANACVDFFQFANGVWLVRDTIPAGYGRSGVARDMSDRNQLVVRSVLDDAMARRSSLPANSTARKLGTFYATCMDSAAIEQAERLFPGLFTADCGVS